MTASGQKTLPSVAVVVPVKDDRRLRTCVEALLRQTYPRLERVVVADNGSTHDVRDDLPDDPRVQVISVPDGGSYTARNAAVALLDSDVVAFTDSDCIPSPSWVEKGVGALLAGTDVAAGRIDVFNPVDRLHPVAAYELVHAFPQERYVGRRGACVTANVITTREVVRAVGPFRDRLRSGADVEWGQRAHAMGMSVRYVDSARVSHPARASYRALRNKVERVIRGRWERDLLEGTAATSPRFRVDMLKPPLGAARRARQDPRLHGAGDALRLFIGESYARLVAARAYWRLRREQLPHV